MRVKRLDVFGFKSFAKKTTIHFEPGVTAIVGPNGSGKCVHGNSRVILADGRVIPIQDLVEQALERSAAPERWDDGFCTRENPQALHVLSLNPISLKIEPCPIAAFVKRKAPETLYRIVTKTGRELVATGYHPLFTLEHGCLKTLPADQLRPGIRVALPRSLPAFAPTDGVDLLAIIQRFEREDSVYVPYSPALEEWVDQLSEEHGGLATASRVAGVKPLHVRMVREGQALNLATAQRLYARFGGSVEAWIGSTLKSRTHGEMTIPRRWTPGLSRFLGYCISEGRNTSADQVWFVNSDPALIEDFCRCTTSTFGLRPRVLSYKPGTKDILVFSHALCQFLDKAFQMTINQPSRDKRVPDGLFAASEACVTAFLSALFEGDGHVCVKTNERGNTLAYVEYATASRRLAEDVCLLLARLGIFGRITKKWKAATNTIKRIKREYFSVMVYGTEQLTRLASVLEFRGTKRKALERLKALHQSPNPNDDLIPGGARLVRELVRKAGVPVKRVRRHFPTLAAYAEERCEATRPGIQRTLDAIDAVGMWSPEVGLERERLRTLATSEVFWDQIVHVDAVPRTEWVYDLAVEGHHNFIANGMFVHNSNIVDSIRWVLGEHNPRDVRAPRLEDVIFNGTDTTAPLSMAEVHLTIANEQGLLPISFSEVTITRRVYRSGESECLINDSPCRLKDVQELLLGTGLGGGTYAIIEQGHIDMILSSKPEERRVVFEEASGVAKYLAKKQETTRRLDETEEHLVRIADIIGEVRRQVGALERAANKARQYKAQWEQLKQSELRLAVDELASGETRAKTLEEQLGALQAKQDELDAQKNSFMSSLEACNTSVSATQEQLQTLRTKVVECLSGIEQQGSQVSLKTRWIGELAQQAQGLEQEAQQLRQRLAQIEEQLATVRGGSTELQSQVVGIQAQVAQGGEELAVLEASVTAVLHTVQEAKTQLFAAVSDASHQRNLFNDSTSTLHTLDARLARYEEQHAQWAAKQEDVERRHHSTLQERAALQAQHDELTRRATTVQQRLDAATARRHELTGRLRQLQEQVAGQRAQVKLCEDLWRRYEGFPDTVKLLMSHSIDGLIGPLVDLVQALPGHEEIVEAALGPLSEALVVRDRTALASCREVLTSQQLDGCRFLVLSDCPVAPVAVEQPVWQEGVGGAVKQYVRTAPAYQPLLDWLLNDSWVVDDIQRLLNDRFVPPSRLVSPRGDRWDRRSWRLTGSTANRHSRLGRKPRWEQAQAGLHTLEEEAARVAAQAHEAEQEWQRALSEQESAKGQLGQLTPALHKLDTVVAQLAQERQRLEEDARASELEAQECLARKEELRVALGNAQLAVTEAEARQQAFERALSDAQDAREASERRRQELVVAKAQIDTTLQSLTDRLQALERRTQELESDRAHLLQQLEAKSQQRREALSRSEELATQVRGHEQSGQQLEEERIRLESEVERVGGLLREEERTRDQVLPHLLAAEQQLSALARQIQEQSQQLSERTFRRARLVERLSELYQIDETAIQAELHAEISPLTDEQRAAMTEQVQKLRAKLEGIGPVSLGSVDEYDELKRRLEFLQTQQQDLTQARDDLKASITQINRAARAQFREIFERIKQEFQHYYARLFDGGEANLILMDEEDVLECGIDIVARPPGKRLQSISLLSGGERALTAVALLFALFKVRPSPFCILDEIDAPLDEANVDRFTRVLEEFLALSQFILITHNKKTITRADSIYGVTMEEAGISKILSAKLTKSNGAPATPAPAAA